MITQAKRLGDGYSLMVLAGVILASIISWFVVVTAVLQNWSTICSSGGLWSRGLPHALSIFGMWPAMALAMMLPSTTAEIVRIASIHHGSQAKSPALRLGLSYLLIAMLAGLVAAALQSIFEPITLDRRCSFSISEYGNLIVSCCICKHLGNRKPIGYRDGRVID